MDGDLVKITVSAPGAAPLPTLALTFTDGNPDGQLATLTLTDPLFQNASVTFAVTKKPGGDGFAQVGYLNATGRDLGSVTVKGDLGAIDCGDANTAATSPALKLLNVRSMGAFGLNTQGGGDLVSDFVGMVGAIQVAGDVKGAHLHATGGADGKIGAVTIGGSLLGGADTFSGAIQASGDLGAVKIGRDLEGGAGQSSGSIQSDAGRLASVTVGGSLLGKVGALSGVIRSSRDLGPVKIAGNVSGGVGGASGAILTGTALGMDDGGIASVTIGGSLVGNVGAESGLIRSAKEMGPVKIGRELRGGEGNDSGKIDAGGDLSSLSVGGSVIGGRGNQNTSFLSQGTIHSDGAIGRITIGGSLIGGDDPDPSDATDLAGASGAILAFGPLGAVKIGGSVIGGSGNSAGGISAPASAIASITIDGSVIGGRAFSAGRIFGGAIGAVKIGGDVLAGPGTDPGEISGSTIASLTIGGTLSGKISGGNLGPVKIGRDILGVATREAGTFSASGSINVNGDIASVTIGGSIIGASADVSSVNFAGSIEADGDIGPIKIRGDLLGGSNTGSALLSKCGYIGSGGRIASIFIGGSIIAGTDTSSSVLLACAAIRAGDDIGAIVIKGSLLGNEAGGLSVATITARGQQTPGATSDLAIKSLTIGGSVALARVLAGFAEFEDPDDGSNGNASIGAVSIGGDWFASTLSAGVQDSNSNGFGIGDDVIDQPPGAPGDALVARIASVVIKGAVSGAPNPFFQTAFTAQQIGSFKAAGFTAPLTAGTDPALLLTPYTVNVSLVELP